jgi:hypothetical protein
MQEILEKIEFLFERYSLERRATTQPYLLNVVRDNVKNYEYDPDDILVRETLMEHVGSLPVLATAFYPYINDNDVSLGESLTMLAIHDVGELMTGDEMTFTKAVSAAAPEHEAALRLLDPYYHAIYEDAEAKGSKSAKFAKSIDKITPDIFDYLTPADITIWRFKHFVGIEKDEIIDLIVKHKRPYMEWNPFMTEFHMHLMDKLAAKLEVKQ